MPEIDPQFESRLTEALRRLAASSRPSAPPQIGAGLLGEFRRHYTRRRRIRRMGIAALAAGLMVAAGLVVWRNASQQHPDDRTASVPIKEPQLPPVVVTEPRPSATRVRPQKAAHRIIASSPAKREFLALPGYDPTVPLDELHIVRLQLPASALWQMGAPLNSDTSNRPMLADFVVGQDGTPYAVRFLQ